MQINVKKVYGRRLHHLRVTPSSGSPLLDFSQPLQKAEMPTVVRLHSSGQLRVRENLFSLSLLVKLSPCWPLHHTKISRKHMKSPFFVVNSRPCCHRRSFVEKSCLLSRIYFMRCCYFLGHVTCRNLPWQGLYSHIPS